MAEKVITDFDLPLSPIASAREKITTDHSPDDEPNQQSPESPIHYKVID